LIYTDAIDPYSTLRIGKAKMLESIPQILPDDELLSIAPQKAIIFFTLPIR